MNVRIVPGALHSECGSIRIRCRASGLQDRYTAGKDQQERLGTFSREEPNRSPLRGSVGGGQAFDRGSERVRLPHPGLIRSSCGKVLPSRCSCACWSSSYLRSTLVRVRFRDVAIRPLARRSVQLAYNGKVPVQLRAGGLRSSGLTRPEPLYCSNGSTKGIPQEH